VTGDGKKYEGPLRTRDNRGRELAIRKGERREHVGKRPREIMGKSRRKNKVCQKSAPAHKGRRAVPHEREQGTRTSQKATRAAGMKKEKMNQWRKNGTNGNRGRRFTLVGVKEREISRARLILRPFWAPIKRIEFGRASKRKQIQSSAANSRLSQNVHHRVKKKRF